MAQGGDWRFAGQCRDDNRAGRTTLASIFRQAGYHTGAVGKWHLGLGPNGGPEWNSEIRPNPNDIGFDYSFIMAATGDRVPTVYIENRRVVGLEQSDPIEVSYDAPIGNWPTGKANPERLKMHPSHGHDQTIVNGISRIGYMSGGKAALWKDEDMADVFTRKARAFIEENKARPFSSTSRCMIRTFRAFLTRASSARRQWGHAAMQSFRQIGVWARYSRRWIS